RQLLRHVAELRKGFLLNEALFLAVMKEDVQRIAIWGESIVHAFSFCQPLPERSFIARTCRQCESSLSRFRGRLRKPISHSRRPEAAQSPSNSRIRIAPIPRLERSFQLLEVFNQSAVPLPG